VPTATPFYANILANGDFSTGSISSWTLYNKAPAASTVSVTGGEAVISISNAGATIADINLRQIVSIENGSTYEIRFRARTISGVKTIEVEAGLNAAPYTSYSGPYASYLKSDLTTTMTEYVYTFTMTAPTDNAARFRFRIAGDTTGVIIDDVVLYKK